ncbi:MAG: hypothetical protein A2V88_16250 [Elusimicrobia bacterium RBG_16_66_12]|nr:MAG: hypothetical protein A2V88_16250 [Elusimicrobia bacterium RBG_16_66_12]
MVVAMLLACVMITSVFSVTLTSKTTGGKNDRRLLAGQAASQVTGRLKNFVTGCDCSVTTGICSAASCTLQGPTPRGGVASWYFNCPTCLPPVSDNRGDVYALTIGTHVISGLLPAFFEAAPYNARVNYTVDIFQTVNGRPVPAVTVNVAWAEP